MSKDLSVEVISDCISAQNLIDLLQKKIEDGTIDPSDPVGVCSNTQPSNEWWMLSSEDFQIRQVCDQVNGDLTILFY